MNPGQVRWMGRSRPSTVLRPGRTGEETLLARRPKTRGRGMEGGKQRAEDEDYDEDYEMSRMTRTTAVPALEPGQKKSRQIALAASVVEHGCGDWNQLAEFFRAVEELRREIERAA